MMYKFMKILNPQDLHWKKSISFQFYLLCILSFCFVIFPLSKVEAAKVLQIAAGGEHTLILKDDGSLWSVGSNSNGELGVDDGSTTPRTSIYQVEDGGVKEISAGSKHSIYLKDNGNNVFGLYGMGDNYFGQLGDGTGGPTPEAVVFNDLTTGLPTQVTGVKDIAAGSNHTLYIKDDGTLWAVGSNSNGQLGIGDASVTSSTTAKQVVFNDPNTGDTPVTNVTHIAAGGNHSLFLIKEDNSGGSIYSLYGMGANSNGQLGDGSNTDQEYPVLIDTVTVNNANQGQSSGITGIAAGGEHSFYIRSNRLWAMGLNDKGQLGDSTTWNRNRPIQVPGIEGTITKVFAGNKHSFYINDDGTTATLYAMGLNNYGQLGTGSTDSVISSSRMVEESISRDVDAVPVAAGTSHSLFLKSDGSLFSMGSNSKGQLGDGTINKSISPVAVKAYLLKIEGKVEVASGKVEVTGGSATGQGYYAYNDKVTLKAEKIDGYVFDGWIPNNNSLEYEFSITEDSDFEVNFSPDNDDDDGDGLDNYYELITYKVISSIGMPLDADNPDSDSDGFNDKEEVDNSGLDPQIPDTDLRTLFDNYVDAAKVQGVAEGEANVEADPGNYNLDSTYIASIRAEGNTTGIAYVQDNLSVYNLYTEDQKNASYATGYSDGNKSGNASGFAEGNATGYASGYSDGNETGYAAGFAEGNSTGYASGIQYVLNNRMEFNILTDQERNASYSQGFVDGNKTGIDWVQANLASYNLNTDIEMQDAVSAAKAEALAEVQADLAREGLSSLTFLEQVTGQAIPHTDGWYFQPGLGWLWTNRDTFPFIYKQATDTSSARWLYFSQLPEQKEKPIYDYEILDWISISGN